MEEIARAIVKRGYIEEDQKWFSEDSLQKLQIAQEEIIWLLDRNYKMSPLIEFVGGHYQLSTRQREALQRSSSSQKDCLRRTNKMLSLDEIKGNDINIDGFNLIITLEVALSSGTLILANDGTIRDLAGLRGTYRLIDKTDMAISLLCSFFKEYEIKKANFYLDSPVSNSGRLKSKILEDFIKWDIDVEVELVPNADPILSELERVVTTDSIILDSCKSWFNLTRIIIENYINSAKVINLSRKQKR